MLMMEFELTSLVKEASPEKNHKEIALRQSG
jgi:hypothetical protein